MSDDAVYPEPSPQAGSTFVLESEAGTSADFLNVHHPDVLLCLANLSNDEVFTPPKVVNAMLDLLPERLWRDPTVTFLDPCCKSGVFLREIAKRLIVGLERAIPDLQTRLDHIFTRQLFGLAITDLTALLSRRSVYCSKVANGRYSLTRFSSAEGNIRLPHSCHTWKDGRCVQCGAQQMKYDRPGREAHAYAFIHGLNPEELFKMKFDVIIGNPPYQLNVGIEKENYAIPIYQKFVESAKRLDPAFLVMIIPARWYAGGRGLDEFRAFMLNEKHIKELHDYPNSAECFPNVDIAGGVCYFLSEQEKYETCKIVTHQNGGITSSMVRPLLEPALNTFIRQNEAISIVRKVRDFGEPTFDNLVSPQTPFGFVSSFKDYSIDEKPGFLKYYTYGAIGFVKEESVLRGHCYLNKHKVYISAAYGERGDYPYYFLGKPFYGEPHSCCSQSYLAIGPFDTEIIARNVMQYISTRFFRALIMLKKNAQHNMSAVFALVPQQDFSEVWTDEKLYRKYGLTADEIAFIERMIKPMEV